MKENKTAWAGVFLQSLVIFICGLIFFSCQPAIDKKSKAKDELLIYCGITMIRPMAEIAEIIEKQENIKIHIIKGGSGNLLTSIKVNKVGDLYFPGSDSYISRCMEEGLVSDSVHVGYNKACILVQKGNPKNISGDLSQLANKDYYVIIGNPDSGSIGKETKKILMKRGIFEDVLKNARELTTDSKRIVQELKSKRADIGINWFATSTWDENKDYVTVLPIDEEYAKKKKLVIGLLKTSKYPDIARKFMEFAGSEEGKAIFAAYGLADIE